MSLAVATSCLVPLALLGHDMSLAICYADIRQVVSRPQVLARGPSPLLVVGATALNQMGQLP